MKTQSIEREIIPRIFQGIEYSGESIVLVRFNNMRLLWRKGGTNYINRFTGSLYGQTELVIFDVIEKKGLGNFGKVIHTGGRLSKALLQQYKEEIDLHFGEGITDLIDAKKTLVIEE